MTDGRNQIDFNAIVGVKDDELYVLEYVFGNPENPDSFKGATGWSMRTITQDEIDERKDPDNAEDEKDIWKNCVANDQTTQGLEDWYEDLCDEAEMNGLLYPFDDTYKREETNELYEALTDEQREQIEEVLGVKGEDYAEFTIGGSGRHFKANEEWQVIIRPDLIELINKYES